MRLNPMKINPGLLALGVLLCFVLACSFGKNSNTNSGSTNTSGGDIGTGAITDIHMAKDDAGDPGAKTESFVPSDRTIHCVAKLKEAKAGTQVKFSWFALTGSGAEKEKIKDVDYTTKEDENIVQSKLFLQKDWPAGKYRVDVYVNDKLEKTVPFSIG